MTDPLRPASDLAPPALRARGKAAQREAFVARRAGDYNLAALKQAMADVLADPERAPRGDVLRWVPIGPSVIQAFRGRDYERASGRVRDVQVSPDGRRAYAATAKGGVWYSGDAGATWAPVGGWAVREGRVGGHNNAHACGCLLVHFGSPTLDQPPESQDFVLVGTGEPVFSRPARPAVSGIGVLAASGPAVHAGAAGDPWEADSGRDVLEGRAIFRLARHPGSVPGRAAGDTADRVLAATDSGLFLGTRETGPDGDRYRWEPKPALDSFAGFTGAPVVTDLLWLPGGPDGRIVVAVTGRLQTADGLASTGSGVAISDNVGGSFGWVSGLDLGSSAAGPAGGTAVGRLSLGPAAGGRVYVLGDVQTSPATPPVNTLWRVPDIGSAAPAATAALIFPPSTAVISGPHRIWLAGDPAHPQRSQRDYDQAIAVDVVTGPSGTTDRVYLGGDVWITQRGNQLVGRSSLWCFELPDTGPPPGAPTGVAGISTVADGAEIEGLVGNDVHADVHVIRLVGPAGARQVWVGADGGVHVSIQAGRVDTFATRVTGLAALEVNFLAAHPTSSHYVAIGTQDNGRQVRVGDTVWEETVAGDGGGIAFHPNHTHRIVSQYIRGDWQCRPSAGYVDPLSRGSTPSSVGRERELAAFYSGAAAVRGSPAVGRIALGTNRVWLTDDLGSRRPNTWRVLPFPGPAAARDPRPNGSDTPANRGFGVPGGGALGPVTGGIGMLGAVLTLRWAMATQLLVVFEKGVVRWTQTGTDWSTEVLLSPGGDPDPDRCLLTDVAPVPGTQDFYLTTTGSTSDPINTCYLFDFGAQLFRPAQLRQQLGPLDPAQAVATDPTTTPPTVYVGTVTGVWQGTPTGVDAASGAARHDWRPLVNGLPEALVQDLSVWVDPAATPGSPRLLRAAVQSRGVWEVDLASAAEPRRTYLRVHARDDRRRLPTPMANPRLRPGASDEPVYASPDIVVRPRDVLPAWQFGAAGRMHAGHAPPYQLWTFQTAFRWYYPSVIANGRWSEAFAALVRLHRTTPPVSLSDQAIIDEDLWNLVVGGTRLDPAAGARVATGGTPAVYREPWHTPAAMDAPATEIDIMDCVVPPAETNGVWRAYREPSMVDVLVHHRDSRPVPPRDTFAILLWRSARMRNPLLTSAGNDVAAVPDYVRDVLAAERADVPAATLPRPTLGTLPPTPTGWRLAGAAGGRALHRLRVMLAARLPRAVPIPVDLSTVPAAHRFVLFLAVAGSQIDLCSAAPVGLPVAPPGGAPPPVGPGDLVRSWPYAALRLVAVANRPAP